MQAKLDTADHSVRLQPPDSWFSGHKSLQSGPELSHAARHWARAGQPSSQPSLQVLDVEPSSFAVSSSVGERPKVYHYYYYYYYYFLGRGKGVRSICGGCGIGGICTR
jgi:hypothetical protein